VHRIGLSISLDFNYSTIQPEHFVDSLPYAVHTNREMHLMLKGIQPLAVIVELFTNAVNRVAEGNGELTPLLF
jgi:hypothetical protein